MTDINIYESSYPVLPSLIRIINLASGDVRPASRSITALYFPSGYEIVGRVIEV